MIALFYINTQPGAAICVLGERNQIFLHRRWKWQPPAITQDIWSISLAHSSAFTSCGTLFGHNEKMQHLRAQEFYKQRTRSCDSVGWINCLFHLVKTLSKESWFLWLFNTQKMNSQHSHENVEMLCYTGIKHLIILYYSKQNDNKVFQITHFHITCL